MNVRTIYFTCSKARMRINYLFKINSVPEVLLRWHKPKCSRYQALCPLQNGSVCFSPSYWSRDHKGIILTCRESLFRVNGDRFSRKYLQREKRNFSWGTYQFDFRTLIALILHVTTGTSISKKLNTIPCYLCFHPRRMCRTVRQSFSW